MKFYFLSVLCVLLTLITDTSQAKIFPERTELNSDVISISDPGADLHLRIWAIDHAKKSLWISTWVLGMDSYGVAITTALRHALERGVSVRLMYDATMSRLLGDPFLNAVNVLTDKHLPRIAQIIDLGLYARHKTKSLALNDEVHEKIMIADAGTPDELCYFGGRNPIDISKIDLDSSYFVRAVDSRNPYLGDDFKFLFNRIWYSLRTNFNNEDGTEIAQKKVAALLNRHVFVQLTPSAAQEYRAIRDLLASKPSATDTLAENQFRPKFAQLISNDLIYRLTYGDEPKTMNVRDNLTNDDITTSLQARLKVASSVELYSYSADIYEPLKKSLIDVLERHGTIHLYTNSYEILRNLPGDSIGLTALTYHNSLKVMSELAEAATKAGATFTPFILDLFKTQTNGDGKVGHLHRKQMIIDEQDLYTGSHNFTMSSATKNDEMIVHFVDPRMVQFHMNVQQKECDLYYRTEFFENLDQRLKADNIKRFFANGLLKEMF